MRYIVKARKFKEYGFCNNSGCKKNACNNYTNSSCTGKTDVSVDVKVTVK